MLRLLSGKTHEVLTAVALCTESGCETVLSTSRVRFATLTDAQIAAYIASGEPHDKAGAYAIQGQGSVLVERMEGSWSTVVGLPVTPLAHVMISLGIMQPFGA